MEHVVHTVSAREANHHVSTLLGRAAEGEEIVITRRGRPVAALGPRPPPAVTPERQAASAIGLPRPCSRATARRFVAGWRATTRVEPYDAADLGAAMQASEDHGLAFWDALIWAVAEWAGAAFLITEDLQPGRRLGRVTFVDPFDPASRALLGIGEG
jgi:prevent-host-death family protein